MAKLGIYLSCRLFFIKEFASVNAFKSEIGSVLVEPIDLQFKESIDMIKEFIVMIKEFIVILGEWWHKEFVPGRVHEKGSEYLYRDSMSTGSRGW